MVLMAVVAELTQVAVETEVATETQGHRPCKLAPFATVADNP